MNKHIAKWRVVLTDCSPFWRRTVNKTLLILVLMAGLTLSSGGRTQTFTVLHSFSGSDGSGPAGEILSGDTLYGMTEYGGSYSNGSIYAVKIDGTGFKTLA
jgi:uncharacterized repeat protein (TIGR03803 family)